MGLVPEKASHYEFCQKHRGYLKCFAMVEEGMMLEINWSPPLEDVALKSLPLDTYRFMSIRVWCWPLLPRVGYLMMEISSLPDPSY